MKKIIILIPVFNDWDSLKKLIYEISETIKEIKKGDVVFECIIVNDASTINQPLLNKPTISIFKILNEKNRGHARCNAFGIRYVNHHEKFDYLILMDGDGEDRPIEIKELVNMIKKNLKFLLQELKDLKVYFFNFCT